MSSAAKVSITIIVAGTNDPSNSHLLAEKFKDGATAAGADATLIRLKDIQLDHFDLSLYDASHSTDDRFTEIRTAIVQSDGLVFASPVWNFSVPAHLKNLIDRMGSFGLDPETHSVSMLNGKPTFLIFTGGAPAVAWPMLKRTTSHVGAGLQYFGCSIVGTHFEGSCTLGRGKFGLVVDKRPASLEAMKKKGAEFVELVQQFKETGALPFKHRATKAIMKTAQRVKRKMGL
jgi:multimeric flavodoxin WrbA